MLLERVSAGNGAVYYVSPRLREMGVRHAFSTRRGGVSPAPFDTLNLGNPGRVREKDESARINENYRILCANIGCDGLSLRRTNQVHGSRIVRMQADDADEARDVEADGMMSRDSGLLLSVRVADCVPILLAGDDGRLVAAVHAGWRGVVAGIALEAVRKMKQMGADRIVAAIGPCIGVEAFEVGEEVAAEFHRAFDGSAPVWRGNSKPHADLREGVRMQLIGAGLAAEDVDCTDRCTFRDRDEFFSHRRENGLTGRMAAVIAATA